MEARWQIEAHLQTRARHGGRTEKINHGVDTAALLMEASLGPAAGNVNHGGEFRLFDLDGD
jgi:hypothetical protein